MNNNVVIYHQVLPSKYSTTMESSYECTTNHKDRLVILYSKICDEKRVNGTSQLEYRRCHMPRIGLHQ